MTDTRNNLKAKLLAILGDLPAAERQEIALALKQVAEEASAEKSFTPPFPRSTRVDRGFFRN
jgi:hypothetical protein